MLSGKLAAQTIVEANERGRLLRSLLSRYRELLEESIVIQDLYKIRNVTDFAHARPHLLRDYPQLMSDIAREYPHGGRLTKRAPSRRRSPGSLKPAQKASAQGRRRSTPGIHVGQSVVGRRIRLAEHGVPALPLPGPLRCARHPIERSKRSRPSQSWAAVVSRFRSPQGMFLVLSTGPNRAESSGLARRTLQIPRSAGAMSAYAVDC